MNPVEPDWGHRSGSVPKQPLGLWRPQLALAPLVAWPSCPLIASNLPLVLWTANTSARGFVRVFTEFSRWISVNLAGTGRRSFGCRWRLLAFRWRRRGIFSGGWPCREMVVRVSVAAKDALCRSFRSTLWGPAQRLCVTPRYEEIAALM